MDKYELMHIVDAKLPQEQKDTIGKQIADAVSKNGGRVINTQVWLPKQKLAFPIKKCLEGTYTQVNFESGSSQLKQIEKFLRLNEKVLRFIINKM